MRTKLMPPVSAIAWLGVGAVALVGFALTSPKAAQTPFGDITPVTNRYMTNYSALKAFVATPGPKVRWLESPLTVPVYNYITNGAYESASLWDAYRATDGSIQIGLREDGVVVWRHR